MNLWLTEACLAILTFLPASRVSDPSYELSEHSSASGTSQAISYCIPDFGTSPIIFCCWVSPETMESNLLRLCFLPAPKAHAYLHHVQREKGPVDHCLRNSVFLAVVLH